jgi:hypothetical protein
MPYRQFLFHMRRKAACANCGATVRLRGYRATILGGFALGATWFLVLLLTDSKTVFGTATLIMAIVALALDRWSWHVLPWEVIDDPTPPEG